MLTSTVLSPLALEASGYLPGAEPFVCGVMIGMLTDFLQCAVLYVDDVGQLSARLQKAVDSWPEKFRKRGLELLSQLEKRYRFVKCSGAHSEGSCSQPDCRCSVGLSNNRSPAAMITSGGCHERMCRDLASLKACEIVNVTQYPLSMLSRFRNRVFSRMLFNGDWHHLRFEKEILVPLFRDAKHVKIIDRYIGRSMFRDGIVGIAPGYELTLNWIADCFARHGSARKSLELYCGVGKLNPANAKKVLTVAKNFEAALSGRCGLPVKLYLKVERPDEMPHGRFLITEQTGALVERGFNLLWNDSEMVARGLKPNVDPRPLHDVAIAYCQDGDKIETAMRKLPDVV